MNKNIIYISIIMGLSIVLMWNTVTNLQQTNLIINVSDLLDEFRDEFRDEINRDLGFKDLNCKYCLLSFVGDVGLNSDSIDTIQNIVNNNPDGIFFAGDLSYTSPDDWFELTKKLDKSKVFPAMGNHEVGRDSLDVNYYPQSAWLSPYNQTKSYYSVSNDFIKVIIIDTELLEENNLDEFLKQKQFIIDELDGNTADFEIIVMHRPMYSDQRMVDEYRKQLQPIFDKYKVELVVQAHNHNYQRYSPISFDGISDNNGQVYLSVGTGGRNLYDSGDRVDHKIFTSKEAGIFLLDISNTRAIGKFLTNNNKILDEFRINLIEDDDTL